MIVIRFLISLVLWLTLWVPFYLLGFLVGWIGLLFCDNDSEHMPILWWPWDNSHGINGTLDGNNPKWVYLCNPDILELPECEHANFIRWLLDSKTGHERTFGKRWVWLYWRNPVSNLSLYPMGYKVIKPVICSIRTWGKYLITERAVSGWVWFHAVTIPYGNGRGFYHAFGWKLLDLTPDGRARFMFRISPYRELPK